MAHIICPECQKKTLMHLPVRGYKYRDEPTHEDRCSWCGYLRYSTRYYYARVYYTPEQFKKLIKRSN